jgi:hypothetical protein
MLVQRVAMPARGAQSWTILGDDDVPVGPVERYLAYLTDVERSPNTVKAYAHDLKDYWTFLTFRRLDWREVRLEDLGEYVAWLRLPPAGRGGQVAVLPSVRPHVGASTVNRKLSAVAAFYTHQLRHGVDVGDLLITLQAPGRRAADHQVLPPGDPFQGARRGLGGRGDRAGRGLPASKVFPVGNAAAARRVASAERSRPAASSTSKARNTSTGSQRCAFAVAITSGARRRMWGSRSRRSNVSTSAGNAAGRVQRRSDSLPLPRSQHSDPMDYQTGNSRHRQLTNG